MSLDSAVYSSTTSWSLLLLELLHVALDPIVTGIGTDQIPSFGEEAMESEGEG